MEETENKYLKVIEIVKSVLVPLAVFFVFMIVNLISKIRKEIPNAVLRTSLIVGFPGETEKDFNELCEFVKESKFDRLGAFAYSAEDGTPAAKFPNQVDEDVKHSRRDTIMEIQQKVSLNNLSNKVGNVYECIVENISEDGEYYIGETYFSQGYKKTGWE